ncbi:MAG: hypothetical protein ACK2TX_06840 [Anaerolineales bacterium]
MRSCPHCHKEIQDEAVFCRFCRREVDPPLWLTSLQKCPFCAEWVERGIERCPLCGKDISSSTPFSVPAEEVEQASDLFSRLRQSAVSHDTFDDELENEIPDESRTEDSYTEPDLKHESEVLQTGRSSSWFERMRRPSETKSTEQDEGLAVLHDRRIDLHQDYAPPEERQSPEEEPGEPVASRLAKAGGSIVRGLLILVTALVLVAVGVLGYQRIRASGLLATQPSETPQLTSTVIESIESASTLTPTNPGGTPGVLLPTLPGTRNPDCISWDQITIGMAGETVCAYGKIKRWFEVSDIPYVAIFSEQPGTFAFIDREQTYPDFRPGTCLTAEGIIEIMRATRPFIDVKGNLQECGPEIPINVSTPTPAP